ncbi:hypothetical protein [Halovenus aranensis]|uniref:hypothetical protein n=1 Tax=Halovenus aranensis TaxID=890420 RepID=UPI000B8422B3|nr:hypothetical protein [Halovenus aranensis]
MSKTNPLSARQQYTKRWQDVLDQEDSYYTPEKYQLGIVADYLKNNQVTYTTEGEIFCYPIDILGVKRGTTIAIELKSRDIKRGVEQAQRNSDFVDYSFLSIWNDRVSDELISEIEDLNIGLIGIEEDVTVYSGPENSGQELCKRSSVIETILDDVRSDTPLQQQQ